MGLDFSHGPEYERFGPFGPQWSYTGFNRFRRRLSQAEGFDLDGMAGFIVNGAPWSTVATPLTPLLNHSDCDGNMTPEECKQVAPRLKEIVDGWEPGDYDRQSALELVAAMEYCAEHGETLEFC